jgi:beta-cyano-L-alanine hydratase/nitrilase
VAKRYDVFLVVGVIEKYNGTLYCSVIWVDPAQGLVEQRRKVRWGADSTVWRLRWITSAMTTQLMPTAAEKLIWGQGSHDDVKVVSARLPDSDIGPSRKVKVSATICWENYMPLFRYATYNLGAEIYCAPTVDGRDSWGTTMKHIAFEGRCFVLSANQFSQRKVRRPVHLCRCGGLTPCYSL